MLDHAAKAGATWEQIGAARGTSAEDAHREYREWATGQHDLLTFKDGRFGMSDAEYAAAMARAADSAAYPGGIGARTGGRILCAHADQAGRGAHWLEPGAKCPLTPAREPQPAAESEMDAGA